MKKRIIGGTIFVLATYLTLFLNLYILMIIAYFIVGIYELFKIYKIKNKMNMYFIFYFIIFLLGILSLNLLDMLPQFGGKYLVILVTLIMLGDTFAFLIGKRFGKTHITKISPNKTYEGLIGSIVVTSLIFVLYIIVIDKRYDLTIFGQLSIISNLCIEILILIFAFFGDLLESMLKRNYGIKDSGTIVYGHGGILDRIDSLLLSSIIYICILSLFIK